MVADGIKAIVASRLHNINEFDWDIPAMLVDINVIFPLPRSFDVDALAGLRPKDIEQELIAAAEAVYEEKEKDVGPEQMRTLERLVMLQVIDRLWVEHLTAMEHMRLQAGWQTLRQTRSVDAYKSAGYQQFQTLLETIRHDIARTIFHVNLREKSSAKQQSPMAKANLGSKGDDKSARPAGSRKIGRNEPCPCGSGKKYKHCCGR
jgi:preprotein translocase subunit SecA